MGYWVILYDIKGNVSASLELDKGSTHNLNKFSLKIWGYKSLIVDDYKVSLTLEDAKSFSVDTTINAWTPVIVTFAMLSACLGMLKKYFQKRYKT